MSVQWKQTVMGFIIPKFFSLVHFSICQCFPKYHRKQNDGDLFDRTGPARAAGERVKLRVVNKHAFSVWLFLIEITHVSGIYFRAAFYSVWWLESGCVFSPFIMHNITQFD